MCKYRSCFFSQSNDWRRNIADTPGDTIQIPPNPFSYHPPREEEIISERKGNKAMRKTSQTIDRKNRIMKITILLLVLLFSFLGSNYRQLYSAWTIRSETKRLESLAVKTAKEFQNPSLVEDHFDESLSPVFWEFSVINGAGKASNESAWHAAEMTVDHGLTIHHFTDPDFEHENADLMQVPAADQYNNVTLIGGSGFRPSPTRDIVLKFTSKAGEPFYGSAGVIVQPVGTLQQDGEFAQPFDMFGFAVLGKESALDGIRGSLCYLALNWVPVQVDAVDVDAQSRHTYEIRLHWISRKRWSGTVKVDGMVQCEIPLPAFGPVEVQVWSDNYLLISQPRRWWEIAPAMDLGFQNGGEKEFQLGTIRISEESR